MQTRAKSGQAMVEFLIGLVGIIVLVLGLNQIAMIVSSDFESMLNARMDVAEDLINQSTTTADNSYDPSVSYAELNLSVNVNADGGYVRFQETYPQDQRNDGFEFLRNGNDPLNTMMGSEKGHAIAIESRLMRKVLGRSSIMLHHQIWMPPWDDLQ
jgi:hypothetical protein